MVLALMGILGFDKRLSKNMYMSADDFINAQEKIAVNGIEVNGCHILHVMEDEGEPCFSYSIGINKKQNHADVVILGLQHDTTHYCAL
jgi:hypothetical protein